MRRVIVYDRYDEPLFELAEGDVLGLVRHEEVNGEHSLEVTTTRVLETGWRVLTQDGRGIWREHVVYGTDAMHGSGERPIGTYYCVWSVQPDLMGTRVSKMPGTQAPTTAALALDDALSGTARWNRGTVTNTSTGGASMYDTDGWSAMSTLLGTWGGEIDTTVEVSAAGVVTRLVDYYAMQGDQVAKRRFDFGADLKSVRRRVPDGPLYCRITPRGKGEETESGGYGRKVTIASVNGGKDYLENEDMVALAKLPDGSGGWEFPTLEVDNSECETPAELKAWALPLVEEYTVPKITYEIDVVQLAAEGVDMHGVSLGDAVQVVDGKFGGLRLQARAVAMTVNMLDEDDVKLTLGQVAESFNSVISNLKTSIASVGRVVQAMNGGTMSTAEYLSRLLARINAEVNATGGYTYITEGQGLRTYDKAVSDPLAGDEADSVVELKGGNIRIANSRTAGGDWDWKTVIQSGHIAASLVTAANLVAGRIQSADGNSYWDLDSNTLVTYNMTANNLNANGTIASYVKDYFGVISNYVRMSEGKLLFYENMDGGATLRKAAELSSEVWQDTGGVKHTRTELVAKEALLLKSETSGITEDAQGVTATKRDSSGNISTSSQGYSGRVEVEYIASVGATDTDTLTFDFIHGRCINITSTSQYGITRTPYQ